MSHTFLTFRDILAAKCAIGSALLALCACSPIGQEMRSEKQCLSGEGQPLLTVILEGAGLERGCTERLALLTGGGITPLECDGVGKDCRCESPSSVQHIQEDSALVLLFEDGSVKHTFDQPIVAETVTSSDGCRSWVTYPDIYIELESANGLGGGAP